MRLKKTLSIFLSLLFLLTFTSAALALEGLPLPAFYMGTVITTGGTPVMSGTVVASVEGNPVDLTGGVINNGDYDIAVQGDLSVLSGLLVTFAVVIDGNTYPATTDHEVRWASMEEEVVNLIIDELPAMPADPLASPTPGTYPDSVEVTLSCATAGAEIYYTTDGSSPSLSSTMYTAPINLTQSATVKAKAYKNSQWSNERSFVYTVTATPPADPTADPAPGEFQDGVAVTLSCATAGAEIYYTLDGSSPSQSSTLYTGPVSLTQSGTITAKAYKNGAWSGERSFAYTIAVTPPAAPTADPAPGEFQDSVEVTLSCATAGAEIYYTLDGSNPSLGSTRYTTAINLTDSTTIKAKSFKNGTGSNEAVFTYTVTHPPVRSIELALDNSEAVFPGRPLGISASALEGSSEVPVDWTVTVKDESGAVKGTLGGSGATFNGEWEPSDEEVPGYLPVTRKYGLEVSADFSDEVKTINENITLTSYSIVVKGLAYEGGQLSADLENLGYEGNVSCIFQVTRADGTLADLGIVQAGPGGTVSYSPANLTAGSYSVTVFVWDREGEVWQTLANPKTADFTK